MCIVRMYTAVRDLCDVCVGFLVSRVRGEGTYEAHEVQTPIGLLGVFATREYRLVLVELPLLDRYVDSHDVLPYDAPCADVQMAFMCRRGQMEERGRDR